MSTPKKTANKQPAKKSAVKRGQIAPEKDLKGKRKASIVQKSTAQDKRYKFISAMKKPGTSATQAAKDAGFSPATAYMAGSRLMKNDEVQSALTRERQSLAQRCGITAERIMNEYAAMGFSNIADYGHILDGDGSLTMDLKDLPRELTAAIQEITVESYWDRAEEATVTRRKLKLFPKEVALDKMAKHIGVKGFKTSVKLSTGVQQTTAPDGSVTTQAVTHLSMDDLERLAAGHDLAAEPDADE